MGTPTPTGELRVLTVATKLAGLVYRVAQSLPGYERREMGSQLRRAAVSVVANIAEGNGRTSRREYLHHLAYARGSVREVEAILRLCLEVRLGDAGTIRGALALSDQVGRMLTRLVAVLKAREDGTG